MTHEIHETLPEGFSYADRLQIESFMQSGSIDGASKVCLVAGAGELPRLACRLRPPRDWNPRQIRLYRDGWTAGRRGAPVTMVACENDEWASGYRDAAEGRMKWHLAYCPSHGDHAEGCRR